MEVPICYSTAPSEPKEGEQVFLIDADVSMYFTFIKMAIYYLIIRFLVFDVYNIMVSKAGKFCSQATTEPCMFPISGFNLKDHEDQNVLNLLDILSLVFTVISIVFFVIFRKHQYKLRDWLDFNEISQDDFTVLIENVPRFIYDPDTTK